MRLTSLIGVSLAAVVATGCASETWKEWRSHSSHFASADHMAFSLKNQGGTPKVTGADTQLASTQSWWGNPVRLRADRIE
jgi:hypothetical protein